MLLSIPSLALLTGAVSLAAAQSTSSLSASQHSASVSIATATTSITSAAASASAAAATASVSSPTSNVTGAVFDRFIQIWLENTDFDRANGTSDLQTLAQQGVLLTNYFAVTHPSLPNYVSCAGGDYFGIGDDNLHHVPANVSTVVDILEERGISWGEYQEDMPYAGFTGYNYSSPADGEYVDYVRKHNPLVNYDSVANNASRLSQIKNLTSLYTDLSASTMPQWSFITPNMKNDGHDTTINYAANWTKTFLTPLLNDTRFNAPRTLIVLTFDESETYADQNRVFTLLLGSAVPESLHGTTDDTVYTHYSSLATIENNWGLYHLGRGDVNASMANVFDFVAAKTNYSNIAVNESFVFNNQSGPGALSATQWAPIPKPNMTAMGAGGRGVLPSIKSVWGNYSVNGTSGGGANGTVATQSSTSGAERVQVAGAVVIGAVGVLASVFA